MRIRNISALLLFSLMWSCSGGNDSEGGGLAGDSNSAGASWDFAEEVLCTFESNGYYAAYLASGVNNTPVAVRDGFGRLHTILAVGENDLRLYSQEEETGWSWTNIPVSSPTNRIKCPSLIEEQGTFHAAWIEVDDSSHQNYFVYAKANSSSPGGLNWAVKKVSSFVTEGFSEELKYTAFAVPAEPGKPVIASTQGYPDIQARIANTDGELDFSPLDSGLYNLEKSSDVTLAASGNRVIVMWEENDIGLGPGLSANLVFRTSTDGGKTFSNPRTLYSDGTAPGGDPSVCFVGDAIYVAYQRSQIGGGGKIFVAQKLPGQTYFEKFGDFGMDEIGVIGSGWLPNIQSTKHYLAVSWEESDNIYFDKWDHRIKVALVKDAATTPSVEYLPATSASATDSSVYDLVAHALVSEKESCVDLFWVRVEEQEDGTFHISLMHRKSSLSEMTSGP